MRALFEIIANQMARHRVDEYHLAPVILEVGPQQKKVIDINNDFYFFVNAFSNFGLLNGRISGIGGGNGFDINPLMGNMKIYKYQFFKGKLVVENYDEQNTLYAEVLRVTPIPNAS